MIDINDQRHSIQHFIDWLIDHGYIADNMNMYEKMNEYFESFKKTDEKDH